MLAKLEAFLLSQHELKDSARQGYRDALDCFERISGLKFEDVFLDESLVDEALNKLDAHLSNSTWNSYLFRFKRYTKWLSDPDDLEYPKLWRKKKPKRIDWEAKLKDKWLSESEVWSLISAADHPRDKALFGTTWEGGFRDCEILPLKIGDCRKTSYGFDLTVSGKTGTRTVPICLTAPLLEMWLYNHPAHNDPQSYVWIRRKAGKFGSRFERLKIGIVNRTLKKTAGQAGIRKNVSLYWLRHTQATWVAQQDMNEDKMRKMFGWRKGSPMPGRYAHLTGDDAKKAKLALLGVVKVEERVGLKDYTPKRCLRCGEANVFDADYCKKCGMVLNEKEAKILIEKEQLNNELFKNLTPDVIEWILEQVKKTKQTL